MVTVVNIVLPDRGFTMHVGPLPRIPGYPSLSSTPHKAPARHPHIVFFGNWHMSLELTVQIPGEILRTKDGPVKSCRPINPLYEVPGGSVMVERNYVRVVKL